MDSFYVVSHKKTTEDEQFTVECQLPYTLDLQNKKYSVGVKYAAFVPKWRAVKELSLGSTTSTGTKRLLFHNIDDSDSHTTLGFLARQIAAEFGTVDARAKIVFQKGTWWFVVKSDSVVNLSPALAEMLGLETEIKNDGSKQIALEINFNPPEKGIYQHIHFLQCNEVATNLTNNAGKSGQILETLNLQEAPSFAPYVYQPENVNYVSLEGGTLSKLHVNLYNYDMRPINSLSVDFFIILHVRQNDA